MQTKPSEQLGAAWYILGILLILVSGGVGFTATSLLLKLPKTPDCSDVFWPLASATKRVYCAQYLAEKATVKSLLQAINLVEALPENHSLRPQINSQVEEWASDILKLAENKFQAGDLEGAIATARKIPRKIKAHELVKAQIEDWQATWDKAEDIFDQAEEDLRNSRWNQAFRQAVKLTYIDNYYWASTKYQETLDKIQVARDESEKLETARLLLAKNKANDLLKGVKIAAAIEKDSYLYEQAQEIIQAGKIQLISEIDKLISRQRWHELLQVSNRIPSFLELETEANDWYTLANAGKNAEIGTVSSLEAAITEAEKLALDSPLYPQAQKLITRWQLEIGDVVHLAKAREIAQMGEINDLNQAIAEARLIPPNNPRYQEARQEINSWNSKIQTIEDSPILERAREISFGNNITAWQQAIEQASLIRPNRALYPEAQRYIRRWRANIQRKEDRPILDRAIAIAINKDYSAAIATAQQIAPNRALYQEAQAKINTWRREIKAREYLERAYQTSNQRTPESLSQAIKLAQKIPQGTQVRNQAVREMNQWSTEILAFAQNAADKFSIKEAIRIAQLIPPGTSAYQAARRQIDNWEQRLKPPLIIEEPSEPFREINYKPSL